MTQTVSQFIDSFDLPADPAEAAPFPRGLTLDLVLEVGTLKEILDSYEITPQQFEKILKNPTFRKEYEAHKESMATEGWSFRKKAASQAELYLNMVYRMASSDTTPAAVRADLIKSTVKWAGLDAPSPATMQTPEQLLPQMAAALKDMSDGELELKVLSLVMRKTGQTPTPVGVTYEGEA
jgi:hypothetical protein